jgi:4'-phosphopantetheinyl transferase
MDKVPGPTEPTASVQGRFGKWVPPDGEIGIVRPRVVTYRRGEPRVMPTSREVPRHTQGEGAQHEVEAWMVNPDDLDDDCIRAAMTELSLDERQSINRLWFPRDRRLKIVSRVLRRRAIARHLPTTGQAKIVFSVGLFGKPEILSTAVDPPPRFNCTHTSGLVMCVTSRLLSVGIDVELVRSRLPFKSATGVLSAAEQESLDALPTNLQSPYFFRLWTLKESVAKASGCGLSTTLEESSFANLDDVGQVPAWNACLIGNEAARLASWYPTPSHCASLCVLAPTVATTVTIKVRWDDLREPIG